MSNKYRLIKIYPGSPKLETICKYEGNVWADSNEFTSPIINPENYPEFWEKVVEYPIDTKVFNEQTKATYIKKEDSWYKTSDKTAYTDEMITKSKYINIIEDKVVEKDYEILSVIGNKNHPIPNTVVKQQKLGGYPNLDLHAENHCWDIQSVKRLSDGEIFTVGDIFKLFSNDTYTISSFEINKEFLYIRNKEYNGFSMLNQITKIKQPLFTTEDSVDIFEGDEFYFIAGSNKHFDSKFGTLIASQNATAHCALARFSTKEKAEEYILLNKPCLSLQDVLNIYETKLEITNNKIINASTRAGELLTIVKSKIQQSV